jgi:16S rRNA (uracil1498-N3)-methyltransferase
VERRSLPSLATFFVDEPLAAGRSVSLPEDAVQHARVRRLAAGDALRLTNGRGLIADGMLDGLTKNAASVQLFAVREVPRPPLLRLFVPVADRDRMLWLAEKCAEIGISVWQPVFYHRSASVSPRGEGEKFGQKLRSRMISALEQSGGAWLPEIMQEASLTEALVRAEKAVAERYLLERGGKMLVLERPRAVDVMVGPEGGIEPAERSQIVDEHGWIPASLGDTTLRFETAGVVAAGLLRGLLFLSELGR